VLELVVGAAVVLRVELVLAEADAEVVEATAPALPAAAVAVVVVPAVVVVVPVVVAGVLAAAGVVSARVVATEAMPAAPTSPAVRILTLRRIRAPVAPGSGEFIAMIPSRSCVPRWYSKPSRHFSEASCRTG
jgi:hypothetical protein